MLTSVLEYSGGIWFRWYLCYGVPWYVEAEDVR